MFQPDTRGDKATLTHDERALLETKILPTARKWLHIPGLHRHGQSTLEFWGELAQQRMEV